MGDADGVFVAIAELFGVETVLVGERHGAGDVEHVVHRCGAGADEGLEALDDAPFEQVEQAVVGRAHGRVAELDDLLGGEDLVFVQHPGQPPVPEGEPPGELGVVLLGGGRPWRGALGHVPAQCPLRRGIRDHG
jgi:hypothetical protein